MNVTLHFTPRAIKLLNVDDSGPVIYDYREAVDFGTSLTIRRTGTRITCLDIYDLHVVVLGRLLWA